MEGSRRSVSQKASFGQTRTMVRPRPVSNVDRRVAAQEIKIGERLVADVDLSQVHEADMESVIRALEVISSLSTHMPKLSFKVIRSSDNKYYVITALGVNVSINGPNAARALSRENNRFLDVFDWEWNAGAGTITVLSMMQNTGLAPQFGHAPQQQRQEEQLAAAAAAGGSRRKRGRVIIEGDRDPDFE